MQYIIIAVLSLLEIVELAMIQIRDDTFVAAALAVVFVHKKGCAKTLATV